MCGGAGATAGAVGADGSNLGSRIGSGDSVHSKAGRGLSMKREYRSNAEIELRQEPGEPLKIRGYAAVFNQLSEPILGFRERIMPGAFKKSLTNDVRALVDHDSSKILGRTKNGTLSMREDAHGLYVEIIPPKTTLGQDTIESIRRGDLDQMSFQFKKIDDHWTQEEGQQVRELRDVNLIDVSVVAFPSYSQTSVAVRSPFPDGIPEEIEQRTAPKSAKPPEPSAARKRIEELDKEFGIKH